MIAVRQTFRIARLSAALLLAAYLALGMRGATRAAYAAPPVATPPALPAAAPPMGQAPTPPALPAGLPPGGRATPAGGGRHGGKAGNAATDAQPLHLPAYTPLGSAAGSGSATLDAPGVLGLLAKFAVVLILLFISLRVLRAVMPRMRTTAGAVPGGIVLHSEPIDDKNRVTVLDLGELIVVTMVSGATMTPLTVVEDEEKVAALRARYSRRDEAAPARPAFALALKDALSGRGAARPPRRAPVAKGDGEASDFAYIYDSVVSQDDDRRANDDAAGARLSEALERVRALRHKAERQ